MEQSSQNLQESSRFCERFGCDHPIQQAGMGDTSGPGLAAAVSNAGAFGMLALPVATVDQMQAAIADTASRTERGFGINFLMPMLNRDCVEPAAAATAAVEFFYGPPEADLVALVHRHPTLAGWQVGSVDEARAAVAAGCDYLVLQGTEAGGHVRGTMERDELVQAVEAEGLDEEVMIIVAGGIGDRQAVRDALASGADAVRVGTRFAASSEAMVHPDYVDALIAASADDTVLTTAFGVGWPDAPHRVLKSAVDRATALAEKGEPVGTARFGDRRVPLPVFGPSSPSPDFEGHVDALALYAGRSVDGVREPMSAAAIVAELSG